MYIYIHIKNEMVRQNDDGSEKNKDCFFFGWNHDRSNEVEFGK